MAKKMISMSTAKDLYTEGNNAGRGWAPDDDAIDDAVAAMIADGGRLILPRNASDEVAVVLDHTKSLVAIGGDASGEGAWAVTIDEDCDGGVTANQDAG